MTAPHARILAPASIDWQDGTPVSRTRGDVYFSRRGGVEETRSVFIKGNRLAERFAGLGTGADARPFVIGETGFGTGLNFLVARRLFLETAPAGARLQFVSFEQAPLTRADLERCAESLQAAGHPCLAMDARMLAPRMPPRIAGWHRRRFDAGRIDLCLWLGDADAGLDDWTGQRCADSAGVDAWFLDGFAPGVNPELWSPELAQRLRVLSAPDTSLATFSVARPVREALTAAGFRVERVPARPYKREILCGRTEPRSDDSATAPAAATGQAITVVGAGLAGACVAAALARRGLRVRILEAEAPAAGASGNPWAVLHPRLPLDGGPRAAFLLTAWGHTRCWLADEGGEAFVPARVIQAAEARRPQRLQRVLEHFSGADAGLEATRIGNDPALAFAGAGRADLPALVHGLLDHPAIERIRARVLGVRSHADGHELKLADGRTLDAPQLVIAAGADSPALLPTPVRIGRMRGQLTRVRGRAPAPATPILTGRGHAIPLADGWITGSSYVRNGDAGPPTAAERRDNLARLEAWFRYAGIASSGTPEDGEMEVTGEFTGVRCNSADRAPLAGRCGPGLHVSAAHASSGLLTCPLAAELIAADIAGEPPVLDAELRALLDPLRFADDRG